MTPDEIVKVRRKIEALTKAEFISLFEVYGLCEMTTKSLDALEAEKKEVGRLQELVEDWKGRLNLFMKALKEV